MTASSTSMLRFAIYARVSTEQQAEKGESLSAQVNALREIIARLGGEVAKVYPFQEHATPGSARASLHQLLDDAKAGKFDAVMVRDSSRWSRDPKIAGLANDLLRKLGIEFYVGATRQDNKSAEGRFMRDIAALVDRLHVEKMLYASACSRMSLAKRGWPLGGRPPFGRILKESGEKRRSGEPQWDIDREKLRLVHRMYRLYIDENKTLMEVGRLVGMNPETVRRILLNESGPVWRRTFTDPDTGGKAVVESQIPRLLTDEELRRVGQRAKANQLERAGWVDRKRKYLLSHFVRCANPDCQWSNLSGHQTYDRGKTYAYYVHLSRNDNIGCLKSIPADALEREIISRLGQLLRNQKDLEAAIRSAVFQSSGERDRLLAEEKDLERGIAKLDGEQKRLLSDDILKAHAGTPLGEKVLARIEDTNRGITKLRADLSELRSKLKVVEIPRDFWARLKALVRQFQGFNGYAPIHWPPEAQRLLVKLFFGEGSTRFDRAAKHARSDRRGIFVKRIKGESGATIWVYEAKGAIGHLRGAVTPVVHEHDLHTDEAVFGTLSGDQIGRLAEAVQKGGALADFRPFLAVSTRARSSRLRCPRTPPP